MRDEVERARGVAFSVSMDISMRMMILRGGMADEEQEE